MILWVILIYDLLRFFGVIFMFEAVFIYLEFWAGYLFLGLSPVLELFSDIWKPVVLGELAHHLQSRNASNTAPTNC